MNELAGMDYYWNCTDRDGRIAVMLTAGIAPIPCSVLACISENNKLREYLLQTPKIGSYSIRIKDVCEKNSSGVYTVKYIAEDPIPDGETAQVLYGDFFDHASQGICGYDWLDVHRIQKWDSRKYESIARPTKPLMASDLPDDLQTILFATKLTGVCFSESDAIDVTAHLECG